MRPFFWKNPCIYSLPSKSFPILNSPVPIIAGINLSRAQFEEKVRPVFHLEDNYVIAFLDEDDNERTLEFSLNIVREFIWPAFVPEIVEELKQEYFDYTITRKYGPLRQVDVSHPSACSVGYYFAVILRKLFKDVILDRLPEGIDKEDVGGAIQEIAEDMKEYHYSDDLFFINFCQSQLFHCFIANHYKV